MILRNLLINSLVLGLLVSCTIAKKDGNAGVLSIEQKENQDQIQIEKASLQRVVPGLQGQKDYYVCDLVLKDTLTSNIKLVAMVYKKYRGVVEPKLIKGKQVSVQLKQDPTLINNINRDLQLFYLEGDQDKSIVIYDFKSEGDLFQP